MKAVGMAGGEGSRLRPLTIRRPKPMVPIAGKPVMEHILTLLNRHGITEVVVTVQYLASNIEDYFGNGSQLGMRITYSREDVPLGTAGSVKNAEYQLTEPFIVISGDALTDYHLTDIIKYHHDKQAMATLMPAHVLNPLEFGVIITNQGGHITEHLEKPSRGEGFSDTPTTGTYTTIDERAQVDRSIVWNNSYIGERAELRGALVGSSTGIKSKAVMFEGSVIGDNSIIQEGAIIQPDVKVWPDKEIEAGAVINTSIIWGSQGRRGLFSRFGVTGLVNVDLTPEFATQLGAAYGAILPKGSFVCINRDSFHRTPRMIKRAVIAGLPSAGVNVHDINQVPIPVARYIIRNTDAVGGIHVRLSPHDKRVIDIKFFDQYGLDINKTTERKLENLFFREDFRRVDVDEVGAIEVLSTEEVLHRYLEGE